MRRVLVDGPVVPLSRLAYAHAFGKFLEALVQAEIVTHRVFPAHIRSSEEFIAAGRRNIAKLIFNTFYLSYNFNGDRILLPNNVEYIKDGLLILVNNVI